MLKTIKIEDVKPGMFVHDLKLSWWTHSFVLPRFLIDSKELFDKVKKCGAKEIVIDEDKANFDVGVALMEAGTTEGTETTTARLMKEVAQNNSTNSKAVENKPIAEEIKEIKLKAPSLIKVSLKEELEVASKIVKQAKKAVMNAMGETRTGRISSIEQIYDTSDNMVQSVSRNSSALLSLASLKTKDDYTFMHCVAVGVFMIALGKKLGLKGQELADAGVAGLLHDMGKGLMPDQVLNKPGRLTDAEMDIMRKHPQLGHKILKQSGYTNEAVLDVILHHHERLDGNGYPEKLNSSNMSQLVRMGAITDVYDAVTSKRCYHSAMAPTAGIKLILSESGKHFDADIAKAFVSVIGLYPNNSLIKLSSDKLAIVIEQDETSIAMPKVCIIFSIKSNCYIKPEIVELAKSNYKILSYENPENWGIDMGRFIGSNGFSLN